MIRAYIEDFKGFFDAMHAKGLSPKTLSAALCRGEFYIENIINAGRCPHQAASEIAAALDIKPSSIFKFEEVERHGKA